MTKLNFPNDDLAEIIDLLDQRIDQRCENFAAFILDSRGYFAAKGAYMEYELDCEAGRTKASFKEWLTEKVSELLIRDRKKGSRDEKRRV